MLRFNYRNYITFFLSFSLLNHGVIEIQLPKVIELTKVSSFDIINLTKNIMIIYNKVLYFLEEDLVLEYRLLLIIILVLTFLYYILFLKKNPSHSTKNVFGIFYYYPHKEATHSILLRFTGVILILMCFFYVFLFTSISFYGDKGFFFFIVLLGVALSTILLLLHLYFITLHYKELFEESLFIKLQFNKLVREDFLNLYTLCRRTLKRVYVSFRTWLGVE